MADNTLIEWTDATWNPITGCSVVSPGCTNCNAMKLAGTRLKHVDSRAGLTKDTKAGPVWNGQTKFNEAELQKPLRWKRPRRIFVCAHGDLFAESVPDEWIDRIFAIMALAPQHTFQVLTKRAARMREYVSRLHDQWHGNPENFADRFQAAGDWNYAWINSIDDMQWPLANVWLGVSAEDQARADERIPDLLATPAAIRFVSAEPLLGPIKTMRWLPTMRRARRPNGEPFLAPDYYMTKCEHCGWVGSSELCGSGSCGDDSDVHCAACHRSICGDELPGLDWIIVGGESGQGARPMHPAWPRQIRDQCAAAGTAFFFKQWGTWAPVCAMSEDEINACYKPNRLARDGEDQDNLNDIYGRAQVKDAHVLHNDGSRHQIAARNAFLQGTGAMTMFAIGKKRAGRLLDGIEHNAMPQVRA